MILALAFRLKPVGTITYLFRLKPRSRYSYPRPEGRGNLNSQLPSPVHLINFVTTLLSFNEFPVARCRSEIALFNSVCARSSLLRA